MSNSSSMEVMEGLLPVMVQSGVSSWAGLRLSTGRLQVLGSYGSDDAITEMSANLQSKEGWYDVVIHGSNDGMGFRLNGKTISAEELHSMMLRDGYQNGTKIRLMSCRSGAYPNGGAAQLSRLANSHVVAPTGDLTIFPQGYNGFMPVLEGQYYIAPFDMHEVGKFLNFGK